MSQQFPWFEVVHGLDLEQGDLVSQCPVIVPVLIESTHTTSGTYDVIGQKATFDVVVLTQSCDLVNDKVDMVLVSPYFSVKSFIQDNFASLTPKDKAKIINDIRKGVRPGYCLIADCDIEGFKHDPSIVVFPQLYTIPKKLLLSIVETRPGRVRMLPPYREHLAQAFARFFMRVGLPEDIPEFTKDDFPPD